MSTELKVLLTLENGVIVAKRYSWASNGLTGIVALCDDGTWNLYAVDDNPTFAEYYGIVITPGSTYEEMRKAVLSATGWSFEDEFRWAETDEKGNLIPGTDAEERLQAWLNSHPDNIYDLSETWGAREASQYAPGFELMNCLAQEDVKRLGLHESDLGGPGSSVPCVATSASVAELNAVISSRDLLFVVVDDEGPEEY